MKLLVASGLVAISVPVWAQVTNLDNSPYNMRNSPYNMDNSPYNASATNGVYDNTGNRLGHEVKAPSGVTNYFEHWTC